jgi:hypothetical protein
VEKVAKHQAQNFTAKLLNNFTTVATLFLQYTGYMCEEYYYYYSFQSLFDRKDAPPSTCISWWIEIKKNKESTGLKMAESDPEMLLHSGGCHCGVSAC